MNQYVLTLLIKPDVEEKSRKELLETIKGKVEKDKGKVTKEDLWGNRDLTYPIKKQTSAYYAHFEFEANPGDISSLDKSLKLEEDILRYLLIRR